MALNNTTLTYAINNYQTEFDLGATTNVTPPVLTTGSSTYLFIDAEMVLVTDVPVSKHVRVVRGVLGTTATSHVAASIVLIGLPADFPSFRAEIGAFQMKMNRFAPVSAAVAAAATIVAPGPLFHVTGTTATNIITPPANFVEGAITIIADGAWTFASSAVTNGIAVSGSATAASAIVFTYDAATALWYPGGTAGVGGAGATVSAPVAAAATLAASGTYFHVTGTTATNIITPPTNFSGQSITIIADGAWTWTVSSTVTNGIAQTGAATSAGEAVTFYFDAATALWYPNRRA